jgi:DedD protein
MDRRVKERLVGASILVVLIVLIVPELLSGPPTGAVTPRLPVSAPEPVRNVTVDLATSKSPEPVVEPAPASGAQTQGAHGAAENPASAASMGGAASTAGAVNPGAANPGAANSGAAAGMGDAEGSAPVAQPATPSPAATPTVAPPSPPLESEAPSPTSKKATARSAASGHGWAVQLGSFASRANADKLVRQLRAQGFGVYVVSGGSGTAARYRVRVGPMADRNAASQAQAKLKSSGHAGSLVPPSP